MAPTAAAKEPQPMTVREYALANGLTLQSVYHRLWLEQLDAKQVLGRWQIYGEKKAAQ